MENNTYMYTIIQKYQLFHLQISRGSRDSFGAFFIHHHDSLDSKALQWDQARVPQRIDPQSQNHRGGGGRKFHVVNTVDGSEIPRPTHPTCFRKFFANNGDIFYQYQLVQDFWTINSRNLNKCLVKVCVILIPVSSVWIKKTIFTTWFSCWLPV